MRLDGKTAIITGAAGSIGRASALAFAAEGARMVIVDLDASRVSALAASLGATAIPLAADVTDPAAMERAFDLAAANFGQVDCFFANSGVEGIWSDISDYPHDAYDKVMNVNARAVFLGLQSALRRMADQGSIIITSSVMGLTGSAGNIAYVASKHAVIGMRRSAAAAAGARGIRVNTIHPGFVESEMLRRIIDASQNPAAAQARYEAKAKLGRLVQPEDIAQMAVFLASDGSRSVTNQSLVVDAGVLD